MKKVFSSLIIAALLVGLFGGVSASAASSTLAKWNANGCQYFIFNLDSDVKIPFNIKSLVKYKTLDGFNNVAYLEDARYGELSGSAGKAYDVIVTNRVRKYSGDSENVSIEMYYNINWTAADGEHVYDVTVTLLSFIPSKAIWGIYVSKALQKFNLSTIYEATLSPYDKWNVACNRMSDYFKAVKAYPLYKAANQAPDNVNIAAVYNIKTHRVEVYGVVNNKLTMNEDLTQHPEKIPAWIRANTPTTSKPVTEPKKESDDKTPVQDKTPAQDKTSAQQDVKSSSSSKSTTSNGSKSTANGSKLVTDSVQDTVKETDPVVVLVLDMLKQLTHEVLPLPNGEKGARIKYDFGEYSKLKKQYFISYTEVPINDDINNADWKDFNSDCTIDYTKLGYVYTYIRILIDTDKWYIHTYSFNVPEKVYTFDSEDKQEDTEVSTKTESKIDESDLGDDKAEIENDKVDTKSSDTEKSWFEQVTEVLLLMVNYVFSFS
ncbi:hypothetical protein [Mahella australiensis]|uniref:Uncharacterized protein n=1 Tax=Mahella australiensis (strain DSM 15567 / CIP 107919 / 50-1 BON) TaxID=697281 RepID=F3ZY04_MAHA5|nr:hypothetical protein [Mahella australiensis]AEE97700.1 hypothetical protein Mahau_2554 [Mahella australiensis 50-1 BON]